ncbi:MAG: atoC [Nitrospirae bacterium]|nr:atoC [Nitrospirota bacterium]
MLRTENVLLVDDNELLLSGMKRFFEKDFVNVTASITGEEAIEHMQKRLYHVVILDINLPGISGWEVLEYIKQKSPKTRVIIITSSEDGGIRHEAIQKGASECMGKPFNLDELRYVLMKALSLQRVQRVQKTFPVRFGNGCKGMVFNLSSTGMLIVTDIICECGATLDITLKVTEEERIPLKGRVVRTIESISETPSYLSAESKLPEGMNYGMGIKILEQPQVYSSLISSLLV